MGDTKRELAQRQLDRHRFWTKLLERAKERTWLHASISPSYSTRIGASAGRSRVSFVYVATRHEMRVELYVDRGDEALNLETLQHLESQRETIEGDFGAMLKWQRLENHRACRIAWDIDEGGYADEEEWDRIVDAAIDAMIRFHEAVAPQLEGVP